MRAGPEADGRAESVPSPAKVDAIVDVNSVSRVYRLRDAGRRNTSFTAVDDVSFSVSRGGSLGIVGESGSGKTTLARMIVGLEHPTTGSIVVDGVRVDGRARTRAARRASSCPAVHSDTIDDDAACGRVFKADNHPCKCRLSRPGFTDDTERSPPADRERNIVDGRKTRIPPARVAQSIDPRHAVHIDNSVHLRRAGNRLSTAICFRTRPHASAP